MEKKVIIPEGVEVRFSDNELVVKGPKGELRREFLHPRIQVSVEGNEISIKTESESRKILALLGTWASHSRNMVTGVTKGWEAHLKAVYSHFPMKIRLEGNKVIVQNFLGEKRPRITETYGNVKVEINKDDVTVTGIDKEEVGQTAANIENVARVTGFDRRVFQDGIHITSHCKPME